MADEPRMDEREMRIRAVEAAMAASPGNPGRWFSDAERMFQYAKTGVVPVPAPGGSTP